MENIFEYFIPKKVSNDLIFVPKNLDFDVFDPKLNLQKIEKSQKIRNSGFFLFKIFRQSGFEIDPICQIAVHPKNSLSREANYSFK